MQNLVFITSYHKVNKTSVMLFINWKSIIRILSYKNFTYSWMKYLTIMRGNGKCGQKVRTSCFKTNESWRCNAQHGDCSLQYRIIQVYLSVDEKVVDIKCSDHKNKIVAMCGDGCSLIMAIMSQYVHISSYYVAYLKLIWCYMLIISQ